MYLPNHHGIFWHAGTPRSASHLAIHLDGDLRRDRHYALGIGNAPAHNDLTRHRLVHVALLLDGVVSVAGIERQHHHHHVGSHVFDHSLQFGDITLGAVIVYIEHFVSDVHGHTSSHFLQHLTKVIGGFA